MPTLSGNAVVQPSSIDAGEPQVESLEAAIRALHLGLAVVRASQTPGVPITPANVERPAPRLGEHTREILRECGYADAEIDAMAAAGIVTTAGST